MHRTVPGLESIDGPELGPELEELLGHVGVEGGAHHVLLRQLPELPYTHTPNVSLWALIFNREGN